MGVIYIILKPLLAIGFKVFFRKIYISGKENIPAKGPVIYAVNHPTAFIDPVALGSLIKPTMHFMLRGDMFKSKVATFFLEQLNNIPIYRFRDGFSNMKNNLGTMDKVYQKLNEGRNIVILAEGQTKHEKKMRPIQKGAARMAFGAYEKYGKSAIQIVPVGVNYTDSHKFRSELMIDLGPAIPLEHYIEDYKSEPRKAIKSVTDEISDRMRARIIHIDKSEREPAANILLAIKRKERHDKLLPILESDQTPLMQEWKLAEKINATADDKFSELSAVAEDYQELLTGLGINESAISKPFQFNIYNTLILVIGLIPFIVGFVFNALPLWLSKVLADKKIKKIEFHSSVRYAVGVFGYLFYFILLAIILAYFNWSFWMILSIPFLGYFALIWMDLFEEWNGARSYQGLPASTKEEFESLRNVLLEFVKF